MNTLPQVFSDISKTSLYIFCTQVVKFQTQVAQGQVTRSRQVTSPKKVVMLVIDTYTECPIILKLSVIDIRTSIYNMFISEF